MPIEQRGAAPLRVVIISGLSGAGKTVAIRALEDCGYFCIDNLPATLVETFLSTITSDSNISKIGIGIDIREKEFLKHVYPAVSHLKEKYDTEILFFEAEKEVVLRRYKETRRPHPMAATGGVDIEDAIDKEREMLSVIREAADRIIDTSIFTPHQLRHQMTSSYGGLRSSEGLILTIISFGFKFGAPQNLDLLFDARFLPNPYFVPELKALKGTDKVVADYVLKNSESEEFMSHLFSFIDFLLPHYIKEGRAYLSVGIGCTGGRHRSPAIVEELTRHIRQGHAIDAVVIHRDMG
ncbi:MAG: RNase adapter RapZ [Nitrospirae bacterium]|nr:RNase adapter RapZ [Nitrospirota bacterium]